MASSSSRLPSSLNCARRRSEDKGKRGEHSQSAADLRKSTV